MSLLESLIVASEKAANIARICRQEACLFNLLVQEKSSDEANPRFVQDFKTLADVLIQETVKHDIGKQFPDIKSGIRGEESNKFCNKLGDSICVEVQVNCASTSELLCRVLNGDKRAANLLSEEVHKEMQLDNVNTSKPIKKFNLEQNLNSLGVWIDPIDCTNEYIRGVEKESPNGIYLNGLRCVTVLIGVYNRITGESIIGVVNQPFHKKTENTWRGKCFWGYSSAHSITELSNVSNKTICISSSEESSIKSKLLKNGYRLIEASGAGYKILTVIEGLVDAYLLTKNSTFKWDTCGPQAILKSLGGDIFIFDHSTNGLFQSVSYKDQDNTVQNRIDKHCNVGGVIAVRNLEILKDILNILKEKN